MKAAWLIILLMAWLGTGYTCQTNSSPFSGMNSKENSGMNLIVSDVPCYQVWDKIKGTLEQGDIPLKTVDKGQGIIETGPFTGDPLPGDPYPKIVERYQLEIKCPEPSTTRISVRGRVVGLDSTGKEVEVKETQRYEQRFIDRFKVD